MTGQEVAVKGREMALRDPVAGRPIAVDLDAEGMILELITVDGLEKPTIRLYAPDDIIDRTTRTFDGDTWKVRVPRDGRSYGGSGTTIINARGVQINSFSGGRIVVDGVDVSGYVSQQRGGAQVQMPRAVVTVPSGSVLVANIDVGSITTRGDILGVRVTTTTANLTLGDGVQEAQFQSKAGGLTTGSVGKLTAKTMSGDINVNGGNGIISASTMSGDITILMLAAASVMASTMSGDARVNGAVGVDLRGMVMASSMSGSVRAPQ